MVSLLNYLPLPSLSSLFNTKPANSLAAAFSAQHKKGLKQRFQELLFWDCLAQFEIFCLILKQDSECFPSLHWLSSHSIAAD